MWVYRSIVLQRFISHVRDCSFEKFSVCREFWMFRGRVGFGDRKFGLIVIQGTLNSHIHRDISRVFISLPVFSVCGCVRQALPFQCWSAVCCFPLNGPISNFPAKVKYCHVITLLLFTSTYTNTDFDYHSYLPSFHWAFFLLLNK